MKEKTIKVSILLLMSIGLITGCSCSKKEEEKKKPDIKVNTEENVVKDQEVEGIEMTNASMITEDGLTTFQTKVTNNTGSDYTLNEYNIIVKDKEGNIIKTIPGYVGSTIKAGETKELKSTTNADMSKAYSVEYEVIK